MKHDGKKKIYVELDALLDTRIATLDSLDEYAVDRALRKGYVEREDDNFEILTEGLIEQSTYEQAYQNRDQKILENARPTFALNFLQELLLEMDLQKTTTPFVDRITVIVNVWPYELTKDQRDVLVLSLGHYLPKETWVETTSISLNDLEPQYIKTHYDALMLYHFDAWFSLHAKTLESVPLPQHTFYVPALLVKQYPEQEKKEIQNELSELGLANPFEYLTLAVSMHLGLEMLNVKIFSINTKYIINV